MTFLTEVLQAKWRPPQDTRPSFSNRTVLITGANVGIGLEAAVKFVRFNAAKVILAVRSLSKGEEAQRQIEEQTSRKGVCEVWHLDMLSYESIQMFAERVKEELPRLDIAVLNAAVVKVDYEKSMYGYETIMQVNVLSTVYLALLLLPKLKASKTDDYTPVLEIVGSSTHFLVTKLLDEDTPLAAYNSPENFAGAQMQYNTSKLFLMYAHPALTQLASTGKDGEAEAFVTVVCPGPCMSELGREQGRLWYLRILHWVMQTFIMRQAEEGARTYISGVTQGENAHGKFWRDDRIVKPGPLVVSEQGKKVQETVWREIVEALSKDISEIRQIAA